MLKEKPSPASERTVKTAIFLIFFGSVSGTFLSGSATWWNLWQKLIKETWWIFLSSFPHVLSLAVACRFTVYLLIVGCLEAQRHLLSRQQWQQERLRLQDVERCLLYIFYICMFGRWFLTDPAVIHFWHIYIYIFLYLWKDLRCRGHLTSVTCWHVTDVKDKCLWPALCFVRSCSLESVQSFDQWKHKWVKKRKNPKTKQTFYCDSQSS